MGTNALCFTSAVELVSRIKRHEISPVEVLEAVFGRIERLQGHLNAFAALCYDDALKAAQAAEKDLLKKKEPGALHGIPFSVKDLVWTRGVATTFGSYIFKDNVPAEDAPSVKRLKKAGAILIGKTTTPEFGHKALTDSPLFGVTRNPWNPDRTPGGSSGGAGAAVAAGLGPLAIGTDGGGSVRIPASCTGIVGLKPTLGVIPHPQSPDLFGNLSYIGPMTRTVADAALMLEVMAGPDAGDPHSYSKQKLKHFMIRPGQSIRKFHDCKIAWSPRPGNILVDKEVLAATEKAVNLLIDAGCRVEEAGPPVEASARIFLACYYSGFAARLSPFLEKYGDHIDPTLLDAIEKGRHLPALDLQRAIYDRSRVFQQVQLFFKQYDFLVTPTLSTPALPITHNALEPVKVNGKIAGSMREAWYPYTHPFNLAGNPAISIPCGWTQENLPVGLQIVGPWFSEKSILELAAFFETVKPWADRRPPV
jgi:aspartyl-tRNA(Asn)/glutamyl-tRNA(Gln) amidotransferase subunit A